MTAAGQEIAQEGAHWCTVGSRGRHTDVPQQAAKPFHRTPRSTTSDPSCSLSLQLSSVNAPIRNDACSLASLPGTVLSSIYGHLDCRSASKLALTCHACAAEFNQSEALKRKWLQELAPSVFRRPLRSAPAMPFDPGSDWQASLGETWSDWFGPYQGKSMALCAIWQGDALQHVYAMADQPDFLHALWRAAISAGLCSGPWPDAISKDSSNQSVAYLGFQDVQLPLVELQIILYSTVRLQIPWDWLQHVFTVSAAAALSKAFFHKNCNYKVTLNRLAEEPVSNILFRDYRLQQVMTTSFVVCAGSTAAGGSCKHAKVKCVAGLHSARQDHWALVNGMFCKFKQIVITGSQDPYGCLPSCCCPLTGVGYYNIGFATVQGDISVNAAAMHRFVSAQQSWKADGPQCHALHEPQGDELPVPYRNRDDIEPAWYTY